METILNFITKFTDVARNHVDETKEIIGKEIIDSSASKVGICIDKIKIAFGAKFSLLGYDYSQEELKQIEAATEEIIVCQGAKGRFFIPVSEIVAVGESTMLVRPRLGLTEVNGELARRKEQVFRKFFNTKELLKRYLPKVETLKPRERKKKSIMRLFH